MNANQRLGFAQSATLLLRCFTFMKKYRTKYVIGVLLASCEFAILFATPFLNQKLVEMVTGESTNESLMTIAGLFIMLLLLIPVVALGKYWQNLTTTQGVNEMRKTFFAHLQNLSVFNTSERKTGDYITRLTTDVTRAGNVFQSFAIISLTRFVIVAVISLVLLFKTDLRIALFSIFYCLINLCLSSRLNPYVRRIEQSSREQMAVSASYLLEAMHSIPIVRIFLLKEVLLDKYKAVNKDLYKKRVTYRTMNGISYGVIDFFTFSAQAVGFIVSMLFMLQGEMDLAICVFAASLVALMADATLYFSSFLLLIQPSIVSAKRVFEVLDIPTEHERESKVKIDLNQEIAIALDNVSFAYSGSSKIIDGLTLHVNKGEKLAIVGGSGGGKTTLIKLLQAFYEPTEGSISFFNANANDLSLNDIRKLSSYVPQECTVFDGTILENIGLGKVNSTREEVIEAAKRADIHEFICSLPNDYESTVGERGAQLSGGQRQRIAIARAILKDAPILLLDEATAALDSASEIEVQQSLTELMKSVTTISIAHRISTIQNADRIIVMEAGQIVEEGSHNTLLALNGRYKQLYNNQFK